MARIEIIVVLLVIAIPLVGAARKANIPYPIVLVLGGLVLGFVPGLPHVTLDPQLVLLVFLPPLLYWEAVTAPTDEMRANARWVWTLAIGLTLATIGAITLVFHALNPAFGWAVAVVLGAVVAPTDELASMQIAHRLRVARHVIAIVDGEALLNDAASLVIYAAAVSTVVTGRFALGADALAFIVAALGAVAIGLVTGWLAVAAWRRFEEPMLQTAISVLVPFVAYVPAVHLQWSGVLAVVIAGVYVNRRTARVLTPSTRLFGSGWWETTVFVVNLLIFVVLGMQLHDIAGRVLARHAWTELAVDAAVLTAVVVGLRFAWVFAQGTLPFMAPRDHDEADAKHLAVTAMAGFRGAVSLAAALGIPAVVAGGGAFPERDLIVFLTFAIILVTLVGGGLVLPYAIRALRLPPSRDERDELQHAMRAVADVALAAVDGAARESDLDSESATLLRRRYEEMRDRYDDGDRTLNDAEARKLAAAQRRVSAAQRAALLALRDDGEIDNTVLRRVLTLLDLRELEVERYAERIGEGGS